MQSNEGGTRSVWQATVEPRRYAPLTEDTDADVCVVGAGLAGLTTALELARGGMRVVVLEKESNIGAGETAHTSAHLANAMDDRFDHLERHLSLDAARQARESHGAAIDWIERVARDEGIDCDFRRVDGFLVPGEGEDPNRMEDEHQAALRAGFSDAELLASSPIEGLGGPCIRFPEQGEYHPLRFLNGAADAVVRAGSRIFTDAHVVDAQGGADGRATTADGPTVRARRIVLATNSPAGRYLETIKMLPYRTFVVALEVVPGVVPRALYWDTTDPYHYVRLASDRAGRELLLVGGGDYQSGTKDRGEQVFLELVEWARERFDTRGATVYRWSGQVLEPADHLAFIGRSHADDDVYLCTGDSGQGMTHSVIAAMRIGDLILDRPERWPVYDPRRLSGGAIREYLRDAALMGRKMLDHVKPGDVDSVDDIPVGGGAVLRRGLKEIAAYRDEAGELHERSAICTHAGCVVHWNSTEKSWDCPCHGSRFDPGGAVLNGPAVSSLRPAED
ncbi:MAG TPA: FAD-dependent oxidoreductase [Longimicrobiales bacterium]|nr:FAD-dependent oxidoreductase [Longimicrobiales bacterium]